MLDDEGDYQLAGSVTGPDGRGNAVAPSAARTHKSVSTRPCAHHVRKDPKTGEIQYPNRKGDSFTFEVRRAVEGELRVEPRGGRPAAVPIARNLRNTWHELVLTSPGLDRIRRLPALSIRPPAARQ